MSQQGGGGAGGSWTHTDSLIAGVAGAVAGFSLVLWMTGQIGAVILGHGWPHVDLVRAFAVSAGILHNPGDPRSAWPTAAQSAIPGAAFYYFLLMIFVVSGVFLAIKGSEWVREVFSGSGRGGLGNEKSSWAVRGSLKALQVPGPVKGRMVLGYAKGKLVAGEPRQSVVVMGPSQSGKTTGLAIPAILEWEGPVIATSVKMDLAKETLEWRKKLGNVWVYDPTKATALPQNTWSPLDGARDWGGAKKIANWLVSAGQSDKSGLNDAQFWYTAAGKLLAPHLFAAAANGYTMADVVRWIDTQEDFELRALLNATGVQEAIDAAEASWQREERARSSIYTTAEVVIEAYSDPTVLESSMSSMIRPSKFFDGGMHTLYVCAPGHEQNRLRPVFSTLLKQFITAAYEKAQATGGEPLDPPLLIVLDEAANIAPLSDLDAIASTAAGHGIQLMTVWQDLAQINARYGDRAQTVVNNHRAKVVLSGISDTATLDYVSRLIGSEEVKQTSYTYDAEGRKQKTESRGDKNLAPSDVLRRIKQNEGVLVYGALLPAPLKLRPWYKNRMLKARASGIASASAAFSNLQKYLTASTNYDDDEEAAGTGALGMGNSSGNGSGSSGGGAAGAAAPIAPAQNDYFGGGSPQLPSASPTYNPMSYHAPGYEQPGRPNPIPADGSPYGVPPYANPYTPPAYGAFPPSMPNQPGAPAYDDKALEDLFDFSDFTDWDDDESDAAAKANPTASGPRNASPTAQPYSPYQESPYVDQPRGAGVSEPGSDTPYSSMMQEWLNQFPNSQQSNDVEDANVVDAADEEPPVGRYFAREDPQVLPAGKNGNDGADLLPSVPLDRPGRNGNSNGNGNGTKKPSEDESDDRLYGTISSPQRASRPDSDADDDETSTRPPSSN